MRMGQGVWAGLGHGGITCVLQTQFSSFSCNGGKHLKDARAFPSFHVC